jgi:murein DD-endopeptidase MepM/ murein hydrolase activator NlpD
VTVQSGQTLYSIARANDMSPDELARANSIAPPYAIRVGQRLTVPGRADPVAPNPRIDPQTIEAANAPTSRPQFGEGGTHVVRPGETLFAVGRAYSIDPFTIAEYNQLSQPYALNVGQTLRIPSSGSQASRQDAAPVTSGQPTTLDQQMAARQDAAGQSRLQFQTPSQSPAWTNGQANGTQADGQAVAPGNTLAPPGQSAGVGAEPGSSTFRWPVKGRIISTYGEKPNGMRNEGINIAVPEGTSVRAAGSGIVAYAGSELKGYGNLVLIRHDGGWVTAYAHNKELFVKRGDSVKRGDVIANAGQTGSVTSPQVHFEVRKGATAVDPMKHLDTEQAMN